MNSVLVLPFTSALIWLMGCFIVCYWDKLKGLVMKWKYVIICYIIMTFLTFGWADNTVCERDRTCAAAAGVFWFILIPAKVSLYVTNTANWPAIPKITIEAQ